MADVDQVAKDPTRTEQVNARGTHVLLEAARQAGVSRFIYASTIWVYGDATGPEQIDEDTPLPLPKHFYTATKIAGEMYVRSYGELYDLEHTILRFGIPYGPRARPTAVVAGLRRQGARRAALDDRRRRHAVEALRLRRGPRGGRRRGARPGGRESRLQPRRAARTSSVRSIARTVRDVVGDVPIVHVEGRTADLRGANISGERARAELGWEPTTTFADGVRRYVDWVIATADTPSDSIAASTDGTAAAVLRQESAEL